jgi:outer membrane protein insertion porin family
VIALHQTLFRAFSAKELQWVPPGPIAQAFTFRAFGAGIVFLIALLISATSVLGQQTPLARVDVEGLKRYTREQVVTASGLKIGQTVNEAILDEAANRLLQTGFFKTLGYRVRGAGGGAIVTFEVEEKIARDVPVVFDNFVWFSNEELASAIRREIPSFDGTALETGNLTGSIKAILQRLLQERKVPGHVEYMPLADPSGTTREHVFSVKGVNIPICELYFTGAAAIKEEELKENSKQLFNDDFSRGVVIGFANEYLGSIYRKRGYLRAAFRESSVKPIESAACKNGVAVTLEVEEGSQYSWEKAEWTENSALSAQQLNSALGMKTGEVASSTSIDKGISEVRRAYGTKGHITVSFSSKPEFDDPQRRVTYRFKVREGPQYRMGTVLITGLPEDLAKRLASKWQLASGEVYNSSYLRTFFETIKGNQELAQAFAGKSARIDSDEKPDSKNLTVDVTISFK